MFEDRLKIGLQSLYENVVSINMYVQSGCVKVGGCT